MSTRKVLHAFRRGRKRQTCIANGFAFNLNLGLIESNNDSYNQLETYTTAFAEKNRRIRVQDKTRQEPGRIQPLHEQLDKARMNEHGAAEPHE